MARHKCLNREVTRDLATVRTGIANRTDAHLLLGIRKACDMERTNWYSHYRAYHRWFLRALYAEAHERKLVVPEFDWTHGTHTAR